MSNQKVKEELPFHEEQIKKGTVLQYREQIPNTPFWAIGDAENGYHIIMGKYKFTKEPICKQIEDEALLQTMLHKHLNTLKWDYILSIAICVATDIIKQNKELQNQNNEHN